MLWCKSSFQQVFSERDECVLFPTQSQLFHFIDSSPVDWTGSGGDEEAHSSLQWLPFSIEFPSELSVSEQLSQRHASLLPGRKLFSYSTSKTSKATDEAGARNEDEGDRETSAATRKHFSLLYGKDRLSQQTRMFLAATTKGIEKILERIEASQLHLYEIIREHSPCHLYFDVERENDASAMATVYNVEESDSDGRSDSTEHPVMTISSGKAEEDGHSQGDSDDDVVFERKRQRTEEPCLHTTLQNNGLHFHSSVRQYDAAANAAASSFPPANCCRLTCPVQACNDNTDWVLLEQLLQFLKTMYPELVPASMTADEVNDVADEVTSEEQLMKEIKRAFESVLVTDSLPLPVRGEPETAVTTPTHAALAKFSQHYVIKFRWHVFKNNRSTGAFVKQFVQFLQEKVEVDSDTSVHRSLFFHGEPVSVPLLTTKITTTTTSSLVNSSQSDISAAVSGSGDLTTTLKPEPYVLPVYPRRCVIDQAVYSRNRAMRCLGSCKLGKRAVLQVKRLITERAKGLSGYNRLPTTCNAVFFDALITHYSLGSSTTSSPPRFVDVELPTDESTRSAAHCSAQHTSMPPGSSVFGRTTTLVPSPGPVSEAVLIPAEMLILLAQAYSAVSCVPCEVTQPRRIGSDNARFVFSVKRSRYCFNVCRQHKSNSVYLVLDTNKKVFVQKCFDPDCHGFKSHPIPLADYVLDAVVTHLLLTPNI